MSDAPVNVLIVDDRPEKLLSLEAVLEGLDLNLVRAESGGDALRQLLRHEFAVILLDVNMPAMDGFETAQLIRQRRNMNVLTATTGQEAISILERSPEVAIVLMDIMMPEMDGYETIQLIRQNPTLRRLPIIALTAKAMKGDREKCIEAGASDYISKPVDTNQLLALLRVWLYR